MNQATFKRAKELQKKIGQIRKFIDKGVDEDQSHIEISHIEFWLKGNIFNNSPAWFCADAYACVLQKAYDTLSRLEKEFEELK